MNLQLACDRTSYGHICRYLLQFNYTEILIFIAQKALYTSLYTFYFSFYVFSPSYMKAYFHYVQNIKYRKIYYRNTLLNNAVNVQINLILFIVQVKYQIN